jgi:hypothetical protein
MTDQFFAASEPNDLYLAEKVFRNDEFEALLRFPYSKQSHQTVCFCQEIVFVSGQD